MATRQPTLNQQSSLNQQSTPIEPNRTTPHEPRRESGPDRMQRIRGIAAHAPAETRHTHFARRSTDRTSLPTLARVRVALPCVARQPGIRTRNPRGFDLPLVQRAEHTFVPAFAHSHGRHTDNPNVTSTSSGLQWTEVPLPHVALGRLLGANALCAPRPDPTPLCLRVAPLQLRPAPLSPSDLSRSRSRGERDRLNGCPHCSTCAASLANRGIAAS
jgi:hypothetical protein